MAFVIRTQKDTERKTAGTDTAAEALIRMVETSQQGFEAVECIDGDGNAYSRRDLLAKVDVAPLPLPSSVKQL